MVTSPDVLADPLLRAAREAHRHSRAFGSQAADLRRRRDMSIRQAAQMHPQWSVRTLAEAVGCSENVIVRALRRRPR